MGLGLAQGVRGLFLSGERTSHGSDPLGGKIEEKKAAYDGFDSYCGTYEIDEARKKVTHRLEGSKFPNWIKTDQVRYYEFSGKALVLSTPPVPSRGDEWIGRLTWVRPN